MPTSPPNSGGFWPSGTSGWSTAGSGTGTMQSLAEAVLGNGGRGDRRLSRGVPPEQLQPASPGTIEVESLAERKEVMLELADAVVALPGGFGTLDELFDAFSRFKLGYIRKPCGLLNAGGYYDFLLEFLDRGVDFRSDCETGPGDAALLRRSRRAARRA